MRKRIAAVLALGASLMMSTTALAGTWVDTYGDGYSWQYQNDDGSMVESDWVETDGKWYYIGSWGVMLRCAVTPDNCLVGKDGVWDGDKLDIYDALDEDVAAAYKKIVQTSYNILDYYLFDADQDGTPELFVRRGTCEADYMFYVYTHNGEKAVHIGSFDGGHGGLCTTRDGKLYREYAHMGVYGLCAVIWDGTGIVYNSDTLIEETISEGSDYEDIMGRFGVYSLWSYSGSDLTPFN